MNLVTSLTLILAGAFGAYILLDTVRPPGRRIKLFVGGLFLAGAAAIAAVAVATGDGLGPRAAASVDRVPAAELPGGGTGSADTLTLATSQGRRLQLAHYAYGAFVGSNAPRIEVFVGEDGGPGSLGVAPRSPKGPNSGAELYARDAGDRFSLSLDHRSLRRPRLFSESPYPLAIETPLGVDLRLSPGTWTPQDGVAAPPAGARRAVTRARGRIVAAGRRPVALDGSAGTLTLPDLRRTPAGAPRGSLALVRGRLLIRLDRWVPVARR